MWNKLSLQIKITFLTALILTVMCIAFAVISVLNTNVFYEPIAVAHARALMAEEENPGEVVIIKAPHQSDEQVRIKIAGEIYTDSRSKFKIQSVISAIAIILSGTILSYFITGRTLKPLNTLTDKIEEINENNLNTQLITMLGGGEVARLTNSFNSMLVKLDRAFCAKKLFASNAAHELKTPLANILTNIEVMQMDENPSAEEYKEVIDITKENIERLTVLVQDLLRFNSDIDNELCENINTDVMFEKIISDLSKSIADKNITIISNGNIALYGEKTLLERAFFNLVQNAAKYNKEGGEIKITAANDTIVIEDSGIGIPSECLPQIFDPFYCADKSRSRKLGGNGLGLSIAKQIFDKHDIKITVSSEINKGTKIFLKIIS
ncbi:MAG: HAMP domain-containing histidine kinase [Oscillospiraceae bacterium]|nr:HAMP domain-containing histidine kinase [Oscillospiraceae bacterium]